MSAVLISAILAGAVSAKESFGKENISIKKSFPVFNINANVSESMLLIEVSGVTNEQVDAFIEKIKDKADIFQDFRNGGKKDGVFYFYSGDKMNKYYNSYKINKNAKKGLDIIADGHYVAKDLVIKGGATYVGQDFVLDEDTLTEFLSPIDAPRKEMSILRHFSNVNLLKECKDYADILAAKHGFKRDKAIENAYDKAVLAEKTEDRFTYTMLCELRSSATVLNLSIKRTW
jgi:hypothetical protein